MKINIIKIIKEIKRLKEENKTLKRKLQLMENLYDKKAKDIKYFKNKE